jgi:peroxiredoxin
VIPSVKEWDAKYDGADFEIIGVHYPEFSFEEDYENVADAVAEYGIEYPVVQDNSGTIWRAFRQRFWPTRYVIDKQGNIRYKHIGEGGYDETDQVIAALLAEEG